MKGDKLFGLFEVISNKTVRKKEKLFKRYKGHKDVPGKLVKTKRGFFMSVLHKEEGQDPYVSFHEIDQASVAKWFALVKAAKEAKNE